MTTPTPNRGPLIFVAIVGGGAVLVLLVIGAFLLLRSPSGPTPEELQATGAAQTVAAELTQLAIQQTIAPPVTDTPAPPTNTLPPPVTDTPVPPTPTPTPACTDQATFITDVTIPDNTYMSPSTGFTKTWRLKNIGTCTWTTGYALVFDSGNIMSGPASQNLSGNVAPGASVDLSVVLTSPASNGTHRGNWKLRNDKGTIFGLSGGGPFYVQIIVGPTPTTGPTWYKLTHFYVRQTFMADLDAGTELSTSAGADFWFEAVSPAERYVTPQNGALFLKMASNPSYNDCKNAALSSSKINLNTIPPVSYVCYKTNEGRYGSFELESMGDVGGFPTMNLDMGTWNNP
jgi:Ig-like domain from next to BRCA1 gene